MPFYFKKKEKKRKERSIRKEGKQNPFKEPQRQPKSLLPQIPKISAGDSISSSSSSSSSGIRISTITGTPTPCPSPSPPHPHLHIPPRIWLEEEEENVLRTSTPVFFSEIPGLDWTGLARCCLWRQFCIKISN
ncbi:hypothetical protein ElyMa_002967700 [Elysia marginata]|uniref:Uncharacterized protein n=1 Tax=Elysia marginata TaxID=1093978 RepID=A0AAV4IAN3_9GAST|nr:hypothetical protein ElyMa_002967700 [Elysia marginata]